MKIDIRSGRGLLVAGGAAAVLAVGGTATALAAARDDGAKAGAPAGARVTAAQAADAALAAVPGVAEEVELDDEGGRAVWEIDLLARDGTWRDVTVDAGSGRVAAGRADHDGDEGDDRGDPATAAALRAAKITASSAAGTALRTVPGTVTSVDFGQRQGKPVWEVDVTDAAGTEHEIVLDAGTAELRANAVDED
ncbi:PepSY domain-containing protein [Actinomadura macra]|uniref:PepSY domain-containing protein n=1 Tax=Actinomadura macra TaxID=46164 RepID=UPI0008303182|nr:PepSY domain-containing protein [Actinomadura macra]